MDGIVLNIRTKTKITLPKSGAWIELWDEVLAGDLLGGLQIDAVSKIQSADTVQIVTSLIADWNFIDKDGNKLPINDENVKKLNINDFNVICNHIEVVTKNSSLNSDKKKD